MKILVLTGSPRKDGNSNTLAARFIQGAKEAGHETFRFDTATQNVHACLACDKCSKDGTCVFNDDFGFVKEHLLDSDLVAFASPMYYFGISAQLKTTIDRFYAINQRILVPKKAVLMMTYASNMIEDAKPIISHYEVMLHYLGWTDVGQIIAPGVWSTDAIHHTKFPEMAYQLGKSLK